VENQLIDDCCARAHSALVDQDSVGIISTEAKAAGGSRRNAISGAKSTMARAF
jgi:hypothetical protein